MSEKFYFAINFLFLLILILLWTAFKDSGGLTLLGKLVKAILPF